MKITNLILTTILSLSSFAFAQEYGLDPIPDNYTCDPNTLISAGNLPKGRTTSAGICDTATAEFVMIHNHCKRKKLDCSKISDNDRGSFLDLVRFNQIVEGKAEKDSKSYDKIRVYSKTGGKSALIIINKLNSNKKIVRESCAPYDVFIAKAQTASEQAAMEKAMWDRLRQIWDSRDCGQRCEAFRAQVTADLNENYLSQITNMEVVTALAAATYEEFLSRLLVPQSCTDSAMIFNPIATKVRTWPEPGDKTTLKDGLEMLKGALKEGNVVGMQSICLDKVVSKNSPCVYPHAFPVTEFCMMCNPSGGDCRKAIHVANSWGKTWQQRNHDGWIHAENVLDRTPFKAEKTSLYWMEKIAQ